MVCVNQWNIVVDMLKGMKRKMTQSIIVISDNDDDTKQVLIHHMLPREDGGKPKAEAEGSRITIPKAIVSFQVVQNQQHQGGYHTADFFLSIKCHPDRDSKLYEVYDPTQNVRKLTDQELLNELTRRNCLVVETVYKRR